MASHYRDFPLFWWNFLILESPAGTDREISREAMTQLCTEVQALGGDGIQKIPCHFDLKDLRQLTQDWLEDAPLRRSFPSIEEMRERSNASLSKAALPMGRDLVELLRLDPLDELGALKEKFEQRMQMGLDLKSGSMRDPSTKRVLIPIQFSFPPSDTARTKKFEDELKPLCSRIEGCGQLDLFGAHHSTLENESRIRQDVEVVSSLGGIAMALLLAFVVITDRRKLLNLVPLLLFSIAVSIGVTILVFGSIHGITLGFGPGIVGLSMDYGIHSAFLGPRSRKTWRANWIGLLTTIITMIVLGFSSIPLLRQMMFFATFGLCFNYLIFYLVLPRWPHWFEATFYGVAPRGKRWWTLMACAMLAAVPLLLARPIQLDVQHLNYESPRTEELRRWFFKVSGAPSPYVLLEDPLAPLSSATERLQWARAHGVQYEGIGEYLPDAAVQEQNLVGWRNEFCESPRYIWTETEKKFFAPFLKNVACARLQPKLLTPGSIDTIPVYLRDFHHEGRFLGMFFTQDHALQTELKAKYPDATTPRDIFSSFPKILYQELLWMLPLAFLGAFVCLLAHYRHFGWSLLAVVPFLTGVGLFAAMAQLFQLPLSFISLIALVMVFGCSLDYGVFILDFLLFRKTEQPGVWSALSLCAAATITGFAPLIFASHPVLNDLGHPLLWGTVGTLIGSLWGIPAVHAGVEKMRQLKTETRSPHHENQHSQ